MLVYRSYFYGGVYPVIVAGNNALMASSRNCGDTWTLSAFA
jgi:hypothetical protein